jgi:hypothetical protein
MVDPEVVHGYPVRKYTDEQIEKCKQKIEFIKNRLIDINCMDVEYRIMIEDILKDYESKLWKMEHDVVFISHCETIY